MPDAAEMSPARRLIKRMPWRIQRAIAYFEQWNANRINSRLTPQEAFARVYADGRWGSDGESKFYSGWGSHSEEIVTPYVEAVRNFLLSLPTKPDVVDLGCGDFNVGKRVRDLCKNYVACDVVPSLIGHNTVAYRDLNVDFRCLDMTTSPLPRGDVAFVRQVLQHLSNSQILQIVSKLYTFNYVVLTEHLPSVSDFVPNMDKTMGDSVRAQRAIPSAVVLTEPPFSFRPKSSDVLCRVSYPNGIVETTLYET